MSRWVTRTIHPLHPPFGLDGKTASVPVEVRTRLFSDPLELECDRQWQIAPLTKRARQVLVSQQFQAWHVFYPPWDRIVATVVRFDGPQHKWHSRPLVVSTSPKRVTMGRLDRVMLVQEWNRVHVMRGADPCLLFRLLADPLAEDVMAIRKADAAQELGIDVEDLESLRDL